MIFCLGFGLGVTVLLLLLVFDLYTNVDDKGVCASQKPSRYNHINSLVKYPAMGADHPLPPECHDDQQRLEDAEFSRACGKTEFKKRVKGQGDYSAHKSSIISR